MKKIKKHIKKKANTNTSPAIRMSELIGEYASDYISLGETMEECQSYLNSACNAWNIAVLPEHLREEALRRTIKEYQRLNPRVDDADNLMHDIRILIQKKLKIFPDVNKVIVGALIEPVSGTRFRINVASTDNVKK